MGALNFLVARSYRELFVRQKAKALAVSVYQSAEQFPRTETYALTSQIRRAVVSVVSNIAEGQGRLTQWEFLHFLGQARGSLLELGHPDRHRSRTRLFGWRPIENFRAADLSGARSGEPVNRLAAREALGQTLGRMLSRKDEKRRPAWPREPMALVFEALKL